MDKKDLPPSITNRRSRPVLVRYVDVFESVDKLEEAEKLLRRIRLGDARIDTVSIHVRIDTTSSAPESDEEYNIRIKKAVADREYRRIQYMRLKDEFENGE